MTILASDLTATLFALPDWFWILVGVCWMCGPAAVFGGIYAIEQWLDRRREQPENGDDLDDLRRRQAHDELRVRAAQRRSLPGTVEASPQRAPVTWGVDR